MSTFTPSLVELWALEVGAFRNHIRFFPCRCLQPGSLARLPGFGEVLQAGLPKYIRGSRIRSFCASALDMTVRLQPVQHGSGAISQPSALASRLATGHQAVVCIGHPCDVRT